MNKAKLLYDVITTLRGKENLRGTLEAKLEKGQTVVFSVRNDFEKQLGGGKTKLKMTTEMECEGHPGGARHGCRGRFEQNEAWGRHHHFHGEFHEGIKGKLDRIAFMISVFQALQVETREGQETVLSLNTRDLPEDIRCLVQDKIRHRGLGHHHRGGFLQEFSQAGPVDVQITVLVNDKAEVKQASITAEAVQEGQDRLTAQAEVNFAW